MNQNKKNNIIIGSLCAVVLLMVVGYAAFSSVLNIKGTSSISSNWNIKITKIEEKNIVGGAATALDENGNKKITGIGTLTASFETNLVSPGNSIVYDITVANEGTVNAKLDKITLSDSNNPAIKFTSSGLEEGSELNAGDTAILTVKVEYLDTVTSQPDNRVGTFKVTFDYSQKNNNSGSTGESTNTFTGIVYNYNVNSSESSEEEWNAGLISPGNSIEKIKRYTEDYNSLSNPYFLKHIINNGSVESSEVCFIKNGIHCLKPNDYEASKSTLLRVFGQSACYDNTSDFNCQDGLLHAYAFDFGSVEAYYVDVTACSVTDEELAFCYSY